MTYRSILAAGLVALSLGVSPLAAAAQEQTPITAETITDAHVEAFVKAAIAMEELRREYTDKIANAQTQDAQDALRAEADRVAIQLVDKVKGISAQDYVAISKAAQESPELTQRIAAQVEVMRAKKAEFEKQQAEAAKAQEAQRAAEAQAAAEATKAETSGD